MQILELTPAKFAESYPRARGRENAVSYISFERAYSRDFRKIEAQAAAMAPEGFKAIKCGETSHSRQYSTYRFAIIPAN